MYHADPIFLLRLLCGLAFIPHIVIKSGRSQPVQSFFRAAGFPWPLPAIYLAIAIELVLCPALIFGWMLPYTAWAAALFMLTVAAAVFRVSRQWFWNLGGPEYHLFWAICCAIIAISTAR